METITEEGEVEEEKKDIKHYSVLNDEFIASLYTILPSIAFFFLQKT